MPLRVTVPPGAVLGAAWAPTWAPTWAPVRTGAPRSARTPHQLATLERPADSDNPLQNEFLSTWGAVSEPPGAAVAPAGGDLLLSGFDGLMHDPEAEPDREEWR